MRFSRSHLATFRQERVKAPNVPAVEAAPVHRPSRPMKIQQIAWTHRIHRPTRPQRAGFIGNDRPILASSGGGLCRTNPTVPGGPWECPHFDTGRLAERQSFDAWNDSTRCTNGNLLRRTGVFPRRIQLRAVRARGGRHLGALKNAVRARGRAAAVSTLK